MFGAMELQSNFLNQRFVRENLFGPPPLHMECGGNFPMNGVDVHHGR